MYVQEVKSKQKGKTYSSYLVKESYRTPKGPRSRTVCNITQLPAEVRELIKASLKGKSLVQEDNIKLVEARDYGGIALLRDAWESFGVDQALSHISSDRDRKLLKAMVMARILFPGSKLSLSRLAEQTTLALACDLQSDEKFDEDDLYQAMDSLNGNWVKLEQSLYQRASTEATTIVLYDLTSVYFEGKGPEDLARFGYSRDHRNDRKQVILTIATTSEGVPIHLEVLKGNRSDNSTLLGLLESLRRRFGIGEATFCFDGGMSSRINLDQMEAKELSYVTRQSDETLKRLLKELPQDNQPELWDRTELFELNFEGKRYVVAGSPFRAERDRQRRQCRIDKGEQELQRLAQVHRKKVDPQKLASQIGRALERLKAHKYFEYKVTEAGTIQWELKKEIIEAEAAQDGLYLLVTNLGPAHDKQTIHDHYKNLIAVEDAFRELKSYLKVRPVFHYRPDRVRNHIRICFIAYWLSARIAQQWKAIGFDAEVTSTLRRLQKIRIGKIALGGQNFKNLMAQIPQKLNDLIDQLQATKLFQKLPKWTCSL